MVVVLKVRPLLLTPASGMSISLSPGCSTSDLDSLLMIPEMSVEDDSILLAPTSTWETRIEFHTPGFSRAQLWPLLSFGE